MVSMRSCLEGPLFRLVDGMLSLRALAISVRSSLFFDISTPENSAVGPRASRAACFATFASSLAAFASAFFFSFPSFAAIAASNSLSPSVTF